jgi:hypothetical protein
MEGNMSAQDVFGVVNAAVLPAWLILLFAPRGRWHLLDQVPAVWMPLGLSGLYAGIILTEFGASGGGYDSLAAVRLLFASDYGLLAGWVHYLAFDLMIGAAMARKMDGFGISRVTQAPLLVLIFLFGPLGVFLILIMDAGQGPWGRLRTAKRVETHTKTGASL